MKDVSHTDQSTPNYHSSLLFPLALPGVLASFSLMFLVLIITIMTLINFINEEPLKKKLYGTVQCNTEEN